MHITKGQALLKSKGNLSTKSCIPGAWLSTMTCRVRNLWSDHPVLLLFIEPLFHHQEVQTSPNLFSPFIHWEKLSNYPCWAGKSPLHLSNSFVPVVCNTCILCVLSRGKHSISSTDFIMLVLLEITGETFVWDKSLLHAGLNYFSINSCSFSWIALRVRLRRGASNG